MPIDAGSPLLRANVVLEHVHGLHAVTASQSIERRGHYPVPGRDTPCCSAEHEYVRLLNMRGFCIRSALQRGNLGKYLPNICLQNISGLLHRQHCFTLGALPNSLPLRLPEAAIERAKPFCSWPCKRIAGRFPKSL